MESNHQAQVELTDQDFQFLSNENRLKILRGQIENGRNTLADLYGELEQDKVQRIELDFKIRELHSVLNEEKKRQLPKQKQVAMLEDQLRKIRGDKSLLENKLQELGNDKNEVTGSKGAKIEKLQLQLDKEQANVLKLQAAIEKRRNQLATIDAQVQAEANSAIEEIHNIIDERKKTLDLIELESQLLALLKKRNETQMIMIASQSLDTELTAVLESNNPV